jgi:N-acetylated-alpha-linked acidic dipeptidase
VVYANGGNPDDYALLRQQGIDPRGKIAVVRYSQPYSYRGFKALTAQREGVAALIIYSDPAEDGYKKGAVFPEGPWGPASHIQRGAITYDFMVPGDPLTPGWASVPGARRIPIGEAVSVPKVIALPMSWRDMQPILEKLDGPKAPDAWQGGLPLTYRLGGKKVRLHVKVSMRKTIRPNYVVEARLRGADYPDEWIVMGNHRDAWEFGGVDPSSGTAAMMEVSRVLGEMKQMGFRPRRTLVIASWDGEEDALTGSTEWGEQFAEELKTKAVAYINVDSAASGPDFRPGAVASLAPLLVEVSRSIPAPGGRSLYKEWKKSVAAERREKEDSPPVRDHNLVDTKIGSGSDHTVFLNFLGRPIINLDFDGPYGVYHSVYDDYFWMNHFGDPGYRYHQTATRMWGVLALRLSNADLLPFDFEVYADALDGFIADVEKKPEAQSRLDWARLHQAVSEFRAAGKDLRQAIAGALKRETPPAAAQQGVNKAINQVEANWLNPDGIPGRPWFKHVLYAARYTYAHLELPGLTEAVERGDWPAAATQAYILQSAISRNADLLRQTAGELAPAP